MPKANTKPGTLPVFQVSPWNEKRSKSDHDANADYNVVSEELVTAPTSQEQPPPTTDTHPNPQQQTTSQPAAAVAWKTTKRKAEEDATESQPDSSAAPSPALEDEPMGSQEQQPPKTTAVYEESDDDFDDLQPTATAHKQIVNGTAYLALLPNGNLTGHFVYERSTFLNKSVKQSCGIMAQEVLSYRECTRDSEWRVLRVSLVNFKTHKEATFLIQRTGGDAMKLCAPVEWQGMEESTASELSSDCIDDVELQFECDQLLVDVAADNVLSKVQPSLVGQDLTVNIGAMKVSLPFGVFQF